MGDVVVIGAGLAGLRLAGALGRARKRFEGRQIFVVDAKATCDYLPLLPDVAGGRLNERHVVAPLAPYLARLGVNFSQGKVVRVDTDAKEVVFADGRTLGYGLLVIACGTQTDFYGLTEIEAVALKCDTALEAAAIRDVVRQHPGKKFVVAGGGYTGVEIASHLAFALRRRGTRKSGVFLVERAEEIVFALPPDIQDYCRVNLSRLRVTIHTECTVTQAAGGRVRLSNGITVEDAVLIWTAGVRPPDFVAALPYKKDGRGRLVVDRQMRCADDCLAVGDAASLEHKGRPLRMAVQFALAEADAAASHIVRACAGRGRSRKIRLFDWGYFVPMANGRACGRFLGVRLPARLGSFLHYFTCFLRAVSWRMRLGMLKDLMTDNVLLRRWH
ncbi:MAG: NAD(P)/FAD-dependent oxidoreductase [Deltaproteobacteria bacterium]